MARPFLSSLLAGLLVAVATQGARGVELSDCRIQGSGGHRTAAAQCGRMTVPLNPSDPDGETIELYVARVPALSRKPMPDAFTVIAGGPGAASTEFFVDYQAAFARVMRDRDVILVDQRGTGRSNPLTCSFEGLDTAWDLSPEAIRLSTEDCLASLDADPRFFTTSVAVQDLDALRAALGYEQLNLYGASYGTRVALHYLRRYPAQTRTVVVDGVLPADIALGPGIALDAQAALERMFARCAGEPACAQKFPALREEFQNLSERLVAEPIESFLPDPVSGEPASMRFGYPELAIALRLLSYSTDTVALLPLLLHTANTDGDLAPLAAQAMMTSSRLSEALSYGMHNAVVCTEDVPFYNHARIDRAALEATYLGPIQFDTLVEICRNWPAGIIDDDFKLPVDTSRPVLILSGEADPVTPASNGVQLAASLPMARHIVAAGQGHGIAALGCVPRLVEQFVAGAALDDLDPECVGLLKPAPFFTRFTGAGP